MKCKYGQNGVCEKLFRPNCPDDSSCFEFEMFSNADRIRAMSDEELVVFLDEFSGRCTECENDKGNTSCPIYCGGRFCSPGEIMNWLRQPAKEEQHDT